MKNKIEKTRLFHNFQHSILRKYDIRGVVGDTLFESDAYAIGLSFANYLRYYKITGSIAIIKDARASGDILKSKVIQGLIDGGCNVVDCGVGPTPMCYFSAYFMPEVVAFIAITGSHNPANYNGFKLGIKGKNFAEHEILELAQNLRSGVEIIGGGKFFEKSCKRLTFAPRTLFSGACHSVGAA